MVDSAWEILVLNEPIYITERFQLGDRLVVAINRTVPFMDDIRPPIRVGTKVSVIPPHGLPIDSRVGGIEMLDPYDPGREFAFQLTGTTKEDVPIGSRVEFYETQDS